MSVFIPIVYADEIHTLESNETIYQISQKYNIPLEILLNSNNIHDPNHLPIGRKIHIPEADKPFTKTSKSSSLNHTVMDGDTLYSIAQQYNIDIQTLQNFNELSTSDIIKPGMILTIGYDSTTAPEVAAKTYVVAQGDTLYSIAEEYGTSIEYLQSLNDISDVDTIKPGHTLKIAQRDKDEASTSMDNVTQDHKKNTSYSSYDKIVISSSEPTRSENIALNSSKKNLTRKTQEKYQISRTVKSSAKPSFISQSSALLLDRATPFGVVSKQFPVKGTSYVLKTHSGVFIESDENSRVKAVASGRVLYIVSSHGTFRNILVIQSKSGEMFVYGCQQAITVKQGDFVKKGQVLGRVGIMPLAQKPVLYFAVFKKDKFINPKKFLL